MSQVQILLSRHRRCMLVRAHKTPSGASRGFQNHEQSTDRPRRIAQFGLERCLDTTETVGSNPATSTKILSRIPVHLPLDGV